MSKALPLDGKLDAVATAGVHIGDDPNVVNIGCHDLFEGFERELLFVVPAGHVALQVGVGEGLGQQNHVAVLDILYI